MIIEKSKVPEFDVEQENLKRENEIADRFGNIQIVSEEEFELL